MSDEIEVSMTYRSYQADKPLQRLRSCFVLGPVELKSSIHVFFTFFYYQWRSAFIDLYSQLEYNVHHKIQPYIFRSTNYEYQNTLSFLSTLNSEYKGIKPQSDR